jgi:DNA topoisomerase I
VKALRASASLLLCVGRADYPKPTVDRSTSHESRITTLSISPEANRAVHLPSKDPMAASPAIIETAADAGLRYVTDTWPGITRVRSEEGFSYFAPDGSEVTDSETLDRIRKLAVPPAYEHVWICPDPNGHLQATGFDARGRKQYRYHPRFREVRDENKFKRMLAFGKALKSIRAQVDKDLARPGLTKRKVVAVVVYLLEKSLIRVGNHEYAEANQSFGLTTMQTRHVKVQGHKIEFNFLGKSKVRHRIEIHDQRLARVIKRIQDLPGQELFQYLDDVGQPSSISSADVNAYLHEVAGEHFTAKDFRTWWGSLLALIELSFVDPPQSKAATKRLVTGVMKSVSKQLGNTPAICRKSYVHPAIVSAFSEGCLPATRRRPPDGVEDLIACAERSLIKLLKEVDRQTSIERHAA